MTKDSQQRSGASLPDGSAIPRALFSCSNEYCREEVSYHADQLYWHAAEKRWVCENCWDDLPGPTDEDGRPTRGVTLAEHIIGGDFKAVTLLQNYQAHPTAAESDGGSGGKESNGAPCSAVPPSQDGYYWMKNTVDEGRAIWRVVNVFSRGHPERSGMQRIARDCCGVLTNEELTEWKGVEFHGPIYPPNPS